MRRPSKLGLWLLVLVAALIAPGAAVAQSEEEAVRQMRDLLARGYYNSAAQLEGPNLVQRFPDNAEARYLYARALYMGGGVSAARLELQRAYERSDDPPADFQHLEGLLLAAEGEQDAALAALEAAFGESGAYAHAMDWGRAAWQAGRHDLALEAYRRAAETERGARESWPHLDRGRILAFRGDDQGAIAAFERAIEVYEEQGAADAGLPSPAYVEAFYRLGQVYERMGDFERADVNYQAARSVDPNYAPAVTALEELAERQE